jgi:uncharacterized protein involved in type VI secretion and phage assembly
MARLLDESIDSGLLGGGRLTVGGVAPAIVIQNDDPDGLYRVKLSLPWFEDGTETDWARIAVPFGAPAVVPAIGDEVLVAFEQGDVRFPYVLGRLPNARQP